MYFDAAETKMTDLDTRVAALEAAPGVDLTDVNAAIAALCATTTGAGNATLTVTGYTA